MGAIWISVFALTMLVVVAAIIDHIVYKKMKRELEAQIQVLRKEANGFQAKIIKALEEETQISVQDLINLLKNQNNANMKS